MITLTQNAINEVQRLIKDNDLPEDTGVRIGIKGGGCAGFAYIFDFDHEPGEFDVVFDAKDAGVKVIVDRKSLLYIDGVEVDFNTGLQDRGFKFNNPKADASCGCGTSFTPKESSFV